MAAPAEVLSVIHRQPQPFGNVNTLDLVLELPMLSHSSILYLAQALPHLHRLALIIALRVDDYALCLDGRFQCCVFLLLLVLSCLLSFISLLLLSYYLTYLGILLAMLLCSSYSPFCDECGILSARTSLDSGINCSSFGLFGSGTFAQRLDGSIGRGVRLH